MTVASAVAPLVLVLVPVTNTAAPPGLTTIDAGALVVFAGPERATQSGFPVTAP